MSPCAISIEYAEQPMISGMTVVGFDVGVEISKSYNPKIEDLTTSSCGIGISLEDCWDSDIKGVKIRNHAFGFKLTKLSSAMRRAHNQHI